MKKANFLVNAPTKVHQVEVYRLNETVVGLDDDGQSSRVKKEHVSTEVEIKDYKTFEVTCWAHEDRHSRVFKFTAKEVKKTSAAVLMAATGEVNSNDVFRVAQTMQDVFVECERSEAPNTPNPNIYFGCEFTASERSV